MDVLGKISADPMASAEDIEYLPPIAQLQHPNCPEESWWEHAVNFPLEAQRSVLYPLFTLAKPERWGALEERHCGAWVYSCLWALDVKTAHAFAADCTERALPFFECLDPPDDKPRRAVEARRVLASGGEADLQCAYYAYQAFIPKSDDYHRIAHAVEGAASAFGDASVDAEEAALRSAEWEAEVKKEQLWQWRRLVDYFRGTAQVIQ